MGSTLGKESLGKGVKLPELDSGRLGFSLLLHRCLSQLVDSLLHFMAALFCCCHDEIKHLVNLLLGGYAMLLDLVDSVIQGGDGFPRLFFSLIDGDGVASDLVLEGACDLNQGAEVMLGMLLDSTLGTDGFGAGLAVGVDLESDMFLAAGDPLHGGISSQGLLKGDLLVRGSSLAFLVGNEADLSKVFSALNTVHGGILVLTEFALDHPIDISLVGLGGLDQ